MKKVLFPTTLLFFFLMSMIFIFARHRSGFDAYVEASRHLDVGRYINVAEFGYRLPGENIDGGDNVFFPLFPTLIWLTKKSTNLDWTLAANAAQKITLVFMVFMGWIYVRRQFGEESDQAKLALASIFLHPAALFMFVAYTEALATALLFAFLLLWPTKRYVLLGVVVFLIGLTRPTGLFLAPVTALYWVYQRWIHRDLFNGKLHLPSTFSTLSVGLGALAAFGSLMLIQHLVIGDAFAFLRYRVLWKETPGIWNFAKAFQFDLGMWSGSVLVFWLHLIGGIFLWRESRQLESILCIFSMLIFVYQGKWADMTRYSYAAIPAWMCLYRYSDRKHFRLIGLVVISLLWGMILCHRWMAKGWVG